MVEIYIKKQPPLSMTEPPGGNIQTWDKSAPRHPLIELGLDGMDGLLPTPGLYGIRLTSRRFPTNRALRLTYSVLMHCKFYRKQLTI